MEFEGSHSLHALREKRKFQPIDLQRLYKQGHIEKDYRGYFTFEHAYPFFEEKKLKKYYINEEFEKVEQTIEGFMSEGENLLQRLVKGKRSTEQEFEIAEQLVQLDFSIILLLDYYSGESHLPILSHRQVLSWLMHEYRYRLFIDFIEKQVSTPLKSREHIEGCLGKLKYKKWRQQMDQRNTAQQQTYTNRLLVQSPYRFNIEKD
ncbi:MAG: hypothetical protein LPK26_14320 [Bacillaceae bacterium]|nr:hypothetical protein [Bacillaceae bacterium]